MSAEQPKAGAYINPHLHRSAVQAGDAGFQEPTSRLCALNSKSGTTFGGHDQTIHTFLYSSSHMVHMVMQKKSDMNTAKKLKGKTQGENNSRRTRLDYISQQSKDD